MITEQIIDPQLSSKIQTVDVTNIAAVVPVCLTDANGHPMYAGPVGSDAEPTGTVLYVRLMLTGASANMNVDGDPTPVLFTNTLDADIVTVKRLTIRLACDTPIDLTKFGTGTALTQGVSIGKYTATEADYFITPSFIKDNRTLLGFFGDKASVRAGAVGAGTGQIDILVDFNDYYGSHIRLTSPADESIGISINDDLTTYGQLRAQVYGWSRTLPA